VREDDLEVLMLLLALATRAGFVRASGGEEGDDDEDEDEKRMEQYADGTLKGILGCKRVNKGMWFGVRPAGWRWGEGRQERQLRRCIEKLFE